MLLTRSLVVAAGLLLTITVGLRGEAFDASHVPADAKWVLHLDADATRGSQVWKTVEPKLQQQKKYDELVKYARALAGMDFPRDLHGVTLYGTAFGEESVVVLVHANTDQARVRDLLELADQAASSTHGSHVIYNWNDNKGRQFGAFQSPQRLVIARSEANVKQALDVLGKQAASLPVGSALSHDAKADLLMYVAGVDLEELTRMGAAQSPLAGNVKDVWLSLSSESDRVRVRGAVSATDAGTAEKLRQALEGIRAVALLSVNSDKIQEHQRQAIRTLSSLTATTEGASVRLDWSVPVETVHQFIESAITTTTKQ